MKYSEMLEVVKKENVGGSQFYIAEEMEHQLANEYNVEVCDRVFEGLCDFAHTCWMKSEGLAMIQICKCIAYYQKEFVKGKGKDPLTMSKWDVINVAGCYEF
jgi:hypothetical protein